MSYGQPSTHISTLNSSMEDISIDKKSESNNRYFSNINMSLISKSAIVFKPSNIKMLSEENIQNNRPKKTSSIQKNNANLHTLSTKYGSLVFPEQKQAKKKVIVKPKIEEVESIEQINIESQKTNITLRTIAENPTPQNIEYIFKKPLFLRCLVNEGKIDQSYVSSILKNVSKNDLYFFMNTMTMELTLHSTISACYTLSDIEKNLARILLFKKIIIWYKPYNSNFLVSPTLKEMLPISRSIVGYCALRQKKVITNDPAMSAGFDIDYDLPILRGTESMAIYPVISDYGDVSGVIQFIDLQSQNKTFILSISKYEQSLLKLTVKLVKRQIFKDDDERSIYVPKELIQLLLVCRSGRVSTAITAKTRPSTSYSPAKNERGKNDFNSFSKNNSKSELIESQMATSSEKRNLNNFEIDDNFFYNVSFNFENIIQNMIVFMKKYFDCDGVDIFEYEMSKKKFVRLCDGTEFTESGVGLSFLPVINEEPVFVASGLHMGFPRSKIDRKYANNSALTVAYKYRYKILDDSEKESKKRSDALDIKDEIAEKSGSQKDNESKKEIENDKSNGAKKTDETKQNNDTSETKQNNDTSETKQNNDTSETKQNNDTGETKQNNDTSETKQNNDTSETKQNNDTSETKQNNDTSETKQNNDTGETKQNNDTSETKQNNDTGETKQNNDTSETKQNNDTSETKQNNDTSETKQNNDTGETKQNNDTGETKQNNDTSETKQNNDTSETKQNNDTGETNDQLSAKNGSCFESQQNGTAESESGMSFIYADKSEDPSLACSQFVFTLRSKWMLPSFLPEDLKKLNDISMILCACIHNAQINRQQNSAIKILQRENFLIQVLGTALASYIDKREDKWKVFRKAARDVFGATTCFICSFDGMMIHFHPSNVAWKFDDCIAGKAFNFQELTEFNLPEKVEINKKDDKHVSFSLNDKDKNEEEEVVDKSDSKNDLILYEKLGVAENLKRTAAFHFRFDGKVKGSIELINPTYPEIDIAGQNILGIICSIINPF
ncbi:hypothetical protein M9Y10_016356 [Tritrichomonas musculus]|uniref:GAF domain-containing protein n=1 Tax=Tritrichomonas musculus TaxID=1915356 RepID=A0ABR2HXK9_9EUKA